MSSTMLSTKKTRQSRISSNDVFFSLLSSLITLFLTTIMGLLRLYLKQKTFVRPEFGDLVTQKFKIHLCPNDDLQNLKDLWWSVGLTEGGSALIITCTDSIPLVLM